MSGAPIKPSPTKYRSPIIAGITLKEVCAESLLTVCMRHLSWMLQVSRGAVRHGG